MRARARRRRFARRVTILVSLLVIGISLAVGIYFVSTAGGAGSVDSRIGQLVSTSDFASLYRLSLQPYGDSPSATMAGTVQIFAASPFLSNGKPVVVYVGGDFCPYCAIQRWSLIVAMMRFGNFTDLHYMASSVAEGDYATFTFKGSSYGSTYVAFRPYEAADRNNQPQESVPANYSAAWQGAGSRFPFMNFGDKYVVSGSMISQPGLLQGKNWTQILTSIRTDDSTGALIRQSANMITAVVCKLTGGSPASVCSAPPIGSQVVGLAAPAIPGAQMFLAAYPEVWRGFDSPARLIEH
jgi:hypothetical protein